MCGIAGYITNSPIEPGIFIHALEAINHRGPDGEGFIFFNNHTVGLGHKRLSILDLSDAGKQPMTNEDQTLWLTFNGEIYNFRQLRKELEGLGHCFRSHTDSEVLLHGYEEWGEGLLSKINGMFAFAIWDTRKNELFAARDRFGIKPFLFYNDGGNFAFSSELKVFTRLPFFQKRVDIEAIKDFLIYLYIPSPKTIWENTSKLPPGHFLRYQPGYQPVITQYYSIHVSNNIISKDEAIHTTNELITNSVKKHMESDVPVGLFLSSGYDSSALLSYMQKIGSPIHTFSIGFMNSSKTEHRESRLIAGHFEAIHHELILEEGYLDIVEDLMEYYDEPFAYSSMISYYYVSRLASATHKVVLAGEGGDEAFGGYNWYNDILKKYQQQKLFDRILFQKSSTNKKKEFILKHYLSEMTNVTENFNTLFVFDIPAHSKKMAYEFKNEEIWEQPPLKIMQLLDYQRFVPDANLYRADISGMANSVEVRVPFLDHDMVDFTMSLAPSVYYQPGVKKFLLYENLKEKMPAQFLNLPKRGFANPLNSFWLNKRKHIQHILQGKLAKSDIAQFTEDSLLELNVRQLWTIYILHVWWGKWFEQA